MVNFVILGQFYKPSEHFEEIGQQAFKVRVYVWEGLHTHIFKA